MIFGNKNDRKHRPGRYSHLELGQEKVGLIYLDGSIEQ